MFLASPTPGRPILDGAFAAAAEPRARPARARRRPHRRPRPLPGAPRTGRRSWRTTASATTAAAATRSSRSRTSSTAPTATCGPNPRYDARPRHARPRWARAGSTRDDVQLPRRLLVPRRPAAAQEGFATETLDGRPVAPSIGTLPDADVGSLRVVGLPNLWAHANADYAMTTRLTPVDAGTTDVEVCFLVRADAAEGDATSRPSPRCGAPPRSRTGSSARPTTPGSPRAATGPGRSPRWWRPRWRRSSTGTPPSSRSPGPPGRG